MEILTEVPAWAVILVLVLAAMSAVAMAVNYFKGRKLESVRTDVYQLILKAEHMYRESAQGRKKMEWVAGQARKLLPGWLQAFVSEENLVSVLQAWFDGVKDLLDDGKMNGSGRKN